MKKSELKSGYVIETRSGKRGIVMLGTPNGDAIVSNLESTDVETTWFPLRSVNEDLTDEHDDSGYDIVKVWGYSSNMMAASHKISSRDLIFDKSSPIVKLNTSYEAKVNMKERVVEVGCQRISISQVEELYKVIQKLKNN